MGEPCHGFRRGVQVRLEISRAQVGNMCRGNKREDLDKKEWCAWLCSVTNDRELPREDGSLMLIRVLPSDYSTAM
ncbi:hypothetical protein ALC53_10965 [Atta colombica]|uniref:Uncharacterized protein n=1 Tax=Atta colombica TaxID=520822 RepID=A0A195B1Z4_9HYME|nr:hypothetical protein ALC53_10965 [Atta colombica]